MGGKWGGQKRVYMTSDWGRAEGVQAYSREPSDGRATNTSRMFSVPGYAALYPPVGFHVAISHPTNPEVLEGSDLSRAPVPDWSASIFPTPRLRAAAAADSREVPLRASAIPPRRRRCQRVSRTIASGPISYSISTAECVSDHRPPSH